jgi:hypothetical protein
MTGKADEGAGAPGNDCVSAGMRIESDCIPCSADREAWGSD